MTDTAAAHVTDTAAAHVTDTAAPSVTSPARRAAPPGRADGAGGRPAAVAVPPALRGGSPRAPQPPGEFLETRFLRPLNISQQSLARALGVSRRRVNEFVRGRRAITADTALRLAMLFGNEASFWMQLQAAWDLHEARKRLRQGLGAPD